jgi:hypothetical protein
MFFLLRLAFWLGVVCVLLPSGKQASPEAQISASQAVTLAGAAISDARGFCERRPEACAVGGKVAVAIGHKAEAGARTLIQFVSKIGEKAEPAAKTADANSTGAIVPVAARGTLSAADVKPAWHDPDPVPLPPRRAARPGRPSV